MNERIRELAEQAELKATLLFNKEKLEKFAELIIQECASAMRDMPRYARTTELKDMEAATIHDCIMTIKHHFGVLS
jgi:hypothetical protein